MATNNLSDFRTDIGYYVKGASSATNTTFVDAQTLRTLRDFCRKTWVWRYTLDKISVVADDDDYTLTLPTTNGTAELVAIDWVKWKEDGEDDNTFTFLEPVNLLTEESYTTTSRFHAGYLNETGDKPLYHWLDPDDTLYIAPTPNSNAAGTENMQVKVIVMPALTATKCPDFMYLDWVECIALGTASRIMGMAAQKWYDPKLSEYYGKKYRSIRDDEVRAQRWEGRGRQKMSVRPHPGFTGGSRGRTS